MAPVLGRKLKRSHEGAWIRGLDWTGVFPATIRFSGRLAQLGEHQLDKLGVTGSSPVPPTLQRPARAGPSGTGEIIGCWFERSRSRASRGGRQPTAPLGMTPAATGSRAVGFVSPVSALRLDVCKTGPGVRNAQSGS